MREGQEEEEDYFQGKVESETEKGGWKVEGWAAGILLLESHGQVSFLILEWRRRRGGWMDG